MESKEYWYDDEFGVYIYVKETETEHSEVTVSTDPPYISYFTSIRNSLTAFNPISKKDFEEAFNVTIKNLKESIK